MSFRYNANFGPGGVAKYLKSIRNKSYKMLR